MKTFPKSDKTQSIIDIAKRLGIPIIELKNHYTESDPEVLHALEIIQALEIIESDYETRL